MRLALSLSLSLGATSALAHGATPGSLEYVEREGGRVDERWRAPRGVGVPSGMRPTVSGCAVVSVEPPEPAPFSVIERRTLDCGAPGLAGRVVSVSGLDRAEDVDVLLSARLGSGRERSAVLRPGASSYVFPRVAAPSRWSAFGVFFAMGARHVLGGADHLLFVLGLVLLARGGGALLKTVTAFTLGHSVTLGLSALGLARVSSGAVEACVALSVFALALEASRPPDAPGPLGRSPWVMAGGFGLLHGFAFAGALREAGLPEGRTVTALAGFNLGVEAGQLAVVAGALALGWIARREPGWRARARAVTREALGVAAGYWLVERVGALLLRAGG